MFKLVGKKIIIVQIWISKDGILGCNNMPYYYVVGTQKNHLNEMVFLSTQNMFKLVDKKIITILC